MQEKHKENHPQLMI